MYKLGFIGVGNMGGALLSAALKETNANDIIIADYSKEKTETLKQEHGLNVGNNTDVAKSAKFIFLGVKPQVMEEMLNTLKDTLSQRNERFILVSMAAGLKIDNILSFLGKDYPVIRIMPNTPVAVESGMILYTRNELVTDGEMSEFLNLLKKAGAFTSLAEELFDAGCAVSGCGPAFVYMFINALIEGGIECGLSQGDAKTLAVNTVMGSAKMVIESDKTPHTLKDNVCSPGGCTIEGVYKLEDKNFEDTVKSAVKAAFEKSKKLG